MGLYAPSDSEPSEFRTLVLDSPSSKSKFQTKLNDPRLIRGGHLSKAAACARAAVRRLVITEGIYPAPLRMIEGVERLQPELQIVALRVELEIPHQGYVPIVAARATEGIPPQRAEHARLIVGSQLIRCDLADYVGIEPRRRRPKIRIVHLAFLDGQLSQWIAHHRPANPR